MNMKMNIFPLCVIIYKPSLGTRDGQEILGEAIGPVVWIREDVKDDKGIMAHEMWHVRQSWKTLIIGHWILHAFSAKYRVWCEEQAALAQLYVQG
jgi:hypothetical protein